MDNIPNLFVIGAPKSGTSAFVSGLKQHKDIFVPIYKEPRFFDAHTFYDYKEDYPIKTMEQYLKLYKSQESKNCKYRIDGSVFNMYSETSIKNILKISPQAKFILIIRDPVDAVKSMFVQRLKYVDPKMREISDDFLECWSKLEMRKKGEGFPKGCRNKILFRYDLLYSYEKYIPMLIDLIPEGNLHLERYSDFRDNPKVTYSKIFKFLGVDINVVPKNKVVNPSIHVESTFVSRCMSILANKTLKFRKVISLNGDKVSFFRKLKAGKIAKNKLIIKSDEEISSKFIRTYQYMRALDYKS